ncbi:MAG TPA: sodium/proton-translocating pyrophosphatase, partial [Nitrospiria bacterium]|nr:sodium/proton-translocating pyrophosphatase [Nitrospiria bacterium]
MTLESLTLVFALVAAAVGVIYGIYLIFWVMRQETGNDRMREIAAAVQEGAQAYLNRQYRTVAMVAAAIFILMWIAGFWSDRFGLVTAVGFLIGAVASASAGYVGMKIAVR